MGPALVPAPIAGGDLNRSRERFLTVRPNGSRHCRFTMLPGCGGLRIPMSVSSVIIHMVYVDCRPSLNRKVPLRLPETV